ncbi:SMI1/KNR4 family protein [Paenibacillus sp. JX-17]|uniref:SMI1/KNR4 family protein n=1 Tax=Paenibacillus lacisoli TaxID=3064525 RepID=A0ABT9CHV5_9BACL|nr:SMI1/KNR4 family protein [Paenibacillus sp. JX-17]MDO7908214.1 SMI1/KNR4 family protein [Paenibacillus sp. JX-17]
MNEKLREQFTKWYEEDDHQQIIDTILAMPEAEQDYEVVSELGRAYNNVGQYEEAVVQLDRVSREGEGDAKWHYRRGYGLYYLKRYEEAIQAFSKANLLEPGDETVEELLEWSRSGADKQHREAARRAARQAASRENSSAEREPLAGMDLSDFWEDSEYAGKAYESEPLTDAMIASVEEELGYKLPASYIALMKQRNGGIPKATCFPTEEATSWAEDHIAISGMLGIGRDKSYSLCGDMGSRFMIEDWGYPDIGVMICDCPSAGHDIVMLDYRACGREGEPEVIHVDQEAGYEITFLAGNFEEFIRGLVTEEAYDTSEEDKKEDLRRVNEGQFSPLLTELCESVTEIDQIEARIRRICRQVVEEKGHFSFHADELSCLMYDVQFWLYTRSYPDTSRQHYLDIYSKMIAFGGGFGQGGYAPAWITDWLDQRIREGRIVQECGKLRFTDQAAADLIQKLKAFGSD